MVLVDDVLYTGRTTAPPCSMRFLRPRRPARVQLSASIDRGHRELPIQARFVGRIVQTTSNEIVEVRLKEVDSEEERVVLVEKLPEGAS